MTLLEETIVSADAERAAIEARRARKPARFDKQRFYSSRAWRALRYVTLRKNVVANVGVWLNLNSQDAFFPRRTAMNNTAIGNWHNSGRITGAWTEYLDNRLVDNTEVRGEDWPAAARDVIARSGVQPEEPPH